MSDRCGLLWSVRMRASISESGWQRHLSGAERLVEEHLIDQTVAEMMARARTKSPSRITITTESLAGSECSRTQCLPIRTVTSKSTAEAAGFARGFLVSVGIAAKVAELALESLWSGINTDGKTMRGASIWNPSTGERLELDLERGVRTSIFDYSDSGAKSVQEVLSQNGLTHFRTREAVAVATKNLWAGVLAELCWSDDSDYDTGYVAAPTVGYVRLPGFKPAGAIGGRIYFADPCRTPITELYFRIEESPLLIDGPVVVYPTLSTTEYKIDL